MPLFAEARQRVLALDYQPETETVPSFAAMGRALGEAVAGLRVGARLNPSKMGLLAAAWEDDHSVVCRQTTVGLVTMESEDPAFDEKLENDLLAARGLTVARCQCAGQLPLDMGMVPSDEELLRAAFNRVFAEADLVVTLVPPIEKSWRTAKDVFTAMGGEIVFDQVAQMPGGELCFGRCDDGWWFAVPAEPAAATVCLALYVLPLACKMAGHVEYDPPLAHGVFAEDRPREVQAARFELVKAVWEGNYYRCEPLSWLEMAADSRPGWREGIAFLPPGDEPLPAGQSTLVFLLE